MAVILYLNLLCSPVRESRFEWVSRFCLGLSILERSGFLGKPTQRFYALFGSEECTKVVIGGSFVDNAPKFLEYFWQSNIVWACLEFRWWVPVCFVFGSIRQSDGVQCEPVL